MIRLGYLLIKCPNAPIKISAEAQNFAKNRNCALIFPKLFLKFLTDFYENDRKIT